MKGIDMTCPECDADESAVANVQGYRVCAECGYLPEEGTARRRVAAPA